VLSQQVRGLVGLAATTGLLILVWAAVTGPVALIGSSGRGLAARPTDPTPSATTPPTDGPESAREIIGNRPQQLDLSWLGDLIAWTLLLGLLAAVVAGLSWLWRNRWHRREQPDDVGFDVLPEIDTVGETLARDAHAQLSAVAEGTPRNGIVACWLRLEQVIAKAGLPRHRWETSAEFTVRVLKVLDIDPRAIGILAGLYREARFSRHELDEHARTTAESALRQLHDDLHEPSR